MKITILPEQAADCRLLFQKIIFDLEILFRTFASNKIDEYIKLLINAFLNTYLG